MNKYIKNQNEELQELMYKVPAYLTLYVISHRDKHLEQSEQRSAGIYLSVLCNQGPDEFKDFFTEVKENFNDDLNYLNRELPKGQKERIREIEERLIPAKHFVDKMPENQGIVFRDALLGFITHARSYVGEALESVMLPFISESLRKIGNQRMREIL